MWALRRALNRAGRTVLKKTTAGAHKIQAGKGLLPMYTPGETQDSRDRKAISAEDKADSRTGRDGHKII